MAVNVHTRLFRAGILLVTCACLPGLGADPPAPRKELSDAPQVQVARAAESAETSASENAAPARQEAPSPNEGVQGAGPGAGAERKALNLLGEVDSSSGESRRNENVRITLVDNAVQRELNERMGASATIVREFSVESNYFGAEFGGSPSSTLHLTPNRRRSLHGSIYEMHNNSVFSARSFFQAGSVKPARSNDYGFAVTIPIGLAAALSVDGSQKKIRGNVNGNVLVPLPHERTPLDRDPITGELVDQATKDFINRMMAAYPEEPPNRPDIDPRALNTNSPQSIDDDVIGSRLDADFLSQGSLCPQLPIHSSERESVPTRRRPEPRYLHQEPPRQDDLESYLEPGNNHRFFLPVSTALVRYCWPMRLL